MNEYTITWENKDGTKFISLVTSDTINNALLESVMIKEAYALLAPTEHNSIIKCTVKLKR